MNLTEEQKQALFNLVGVIAREVAGQVGGMVNQPVSVSEKVGTPEEKVCVKTMAQIMQSLSDEMSYASFLHSRHLQLLYGDEATDFADDDEDEEKILFEARQFKKRIWKPKTKKGDEAK